MEWLNPVGVWKYVLFLFVSIIFFFPKPAFAEEKVTLKLTSGADGWVKSGKGFPVYATLINGRNEPISGYLEILFFTSSSKTVVSKEVPIHAEAGETRTIYFSMPPLSNIYDFSLDSRKQILLYEGEGKGKREIPFEGSDRLSINYLEPSRPIVGVFSENMDRIRSLAGLGKEIHWFFMGKEQVPRDAIGFDLLDILVVDEYPLSTLDSAQQTALTEWIERGGVLVLGDTANLSQSYRPVLDWMPLIPEESRILDKAELSLDNQKVELKHFRVSEGTVKADDVYYSAGDVPLILSRSAGKGRVVQTAFSLGDEPQNRAEGYGRFLTRFLRSLGPSDSVRADFYSGLYYSFAEPNERFDAGGIDKNVLLLATLIYIVLLAPGMYFFLKKMDKREWAWWIIPVLSFAVSGLLFLYGAKERIRQPLKNELGIFVSENGSLSGYYAATFQSNKGGDYEMETDAASFLPLPVFGYSSTFGAAYGKTAATLAENGNKMKVRFPDVEYWSVRTLAGPAYMKGAGSFRSELFFRGNRVTGWIENLYPYRFEEIFLWSGTERYSLGPLEPGGRLTVDLAFDQLPAAPFPAPNYSASRDLEQFRKEILLSDNLIVPFQFSLPVVGGFTGDAVLDVDLVGKKEKTNRTVLILEPIKPEIQENTFFQLNGADWNFEVKRITGTDADDIQKFPVQTGEKSFELYLDPGLYEFHYRLPKTLETEKLRIEELAIRLEGPASGFEYTLLSSKAGNELPLMEWGKTVRITDNPGHYIFEDGSVRFRVKKFNNDDGFTIAPQLSLKGRVGQ